MEFEQPGNAKARYGEQLITNLTKNLTRLRGKGFSRSNLIYMRKFYQTFSKSETVSGQLTWSHSFELLRIFLFAPLVPLFSLSVRSTLSLQSLESEMDQSGIRERHDISMR